jgi:lipoate-protein ligase A
MNFPDKWFLWDTGPRAAAWNMACDEALHRDAARRQVPVLRFYGWTEPAATFGYSQRYTDLARWTHLRPLIRRPTGGGLVPHDVDWTYSLAFPPTHPWYALSARASYQRIHEWIVASLLALGADARLSPCCQKDIPGQCFVGAEQFDVLWQGRKIAGAAQRRNRDGLLIQGSVQPPPGIKRHDWQSALSAHASHQAQVDWQPLAPDVQLTSAIEVLARDKYSQPAHNERR